jgi:nucleotide-binding universal stress UspA family protein
LSVNELSQGQADATAAAQKALDRELRKTGIPKSRRHIVGRHPADAIAQTAKEIHSAIVVMGAISQLRAQTAVHWQYGRAGARSAAL